MLKTCTYCSNTRLVQQGTNLMGCPYCMNPVKLETSMDKAIKDCKKNNKGLGEKLRLVRSYLPDYPIMAMLEAEYLGLNNNLILLIRDTYSVLPFGDVKYKENEADGP